jgi:hypothetical protein
MLKGIVSDVTGGADVCKCIPRDKIVDQEGMRYVMPDEKVYIYLKALKEEFIFTDHAIITVIGNSGRGTKRMVTRYDYGAYQLEHVRFETAGYGITDYDCELKFTIGGTDISIDIEKKETDTAVRYYRALVDVQRAQHHNALRLATTLKVALQREPRLNITSGEVAKTLEAMSLDAMGFAENIHAQYTPTSFSDVFMKHFP